MFRYCNPIYNLKASTSTEFLINPYMEFINFCHFKASEFLDMENDKELSKIINLPIIDQNIILQKISESIDNIKIVYEKTQNQYIVYTADDEYLYEFRFYEHEQYIKDLKYKDHYKCCDINFEKCKAFNQISVTPAYNNFILDDCDIPGTLVEFISIMYGFSDIIGFIKHHKIKNLTVKTIDAFIKNIVKNENNSNITYINSYDETTFTVSIIKDKKIYTGTYPYNNYVTSLKSFKTKYNDANVN